MNWENRMDAYFDDGDTDQPDEPGEVVDLSTHAVLELLEVAMDDHIRVEAYERFLSLTGQKPAVKLVAEDGTVTTITCDTARTMLDRLAVLTGMTDE